MEKYYKLLNRAGVGKHSQKPWLLPKGDEPGPWMPEIENIELCQSGYHVCTADYLLDWADEVCWGVELSGKIIAGGNKVVAQRARLVRAVPEWNDATLRRFAVACALDVLPIFERESPGDNRPRRAVEAALAFAYGRITAQEMDAARGAARAAAGGAARAAAGGAARAAARAAAWDAARAAARAAAWDAAEAAAWDAQRARLKRMVFGVDTPPES